MAVSASDLTKLYLAYFGRPPDFDGLQFYTAPELRRVGVAGPSIPVCAISNALKKLTIPTVLALAGCNATLPVLPARTAIPVECKEPKPERPAMPTANLTPESSLDASVQAYQAEIALRDGYEDQLVTALNACTAPVKGKTP